MLIGFSNTLLLWLKQGDLIVFLPMDSSTHYLAFYTEGLHWQAPNLMPAYQAGMQFVPWHFYDGL